MNSTSVTTLACAAPTIGLSIGLSAAGFLPVVAYSEREGRVRIINAREATLRERNQYESTDSSRRYSPRVDGCHSRRWLVLGPTELVRGRRLSGPGRDQFDQLPGGDDARSTPHCGEVLGVASDEVIGFGGLGTFQKAIVSVIGRDSARGYWFNQFGYRTNRFQQRRHHLRRTAVCGPVQYLFVSGNAASKVIAAPARRDARIRCARQETERGPEGPANRALVPICESPPSTDSGLPDERRLQR